VLVRVAEGSDNWPVTWGDDDKIYTAYGDGWGFVLGGQKVRLGVARVSGTPESFSGEDLAEIKDWTEPDPNIKGTGILMVDGVLYLWSRRDGGRLRTSADHGASFVDTGITMQQPDGSFHSLSFCQFGQNYAHARDDYVYVYATGTGEHGGDAHEAYLFRVPQDHIDVPSAYEYFSGLDSSNQPTWSDAIDDRAPVVTGHDSHGVLDIRVVYNPGIERYLMTYWFGLDGGIAILDAPEPWGPWTTVYYTAQWDEGFTFEYQFPQKWISADGLTMYMVFSGTGINDAFVVRRTTLTVPYHEAR
jgi:hypothetical protein